MTLAVARVQNGVLAVAADSLIIEHAMKLPINKGLVKICMLPGYLCAAFAGSPELANQAFGAYGRNFPDGTTYADTITFFEKSSLETGNEYLLGFGITKKLVTVKEGAARTSLSKTSWVGDANAYAAFRRCERSIDQDVIRAVLFADEMEGSPASDLYSAMRTLIVRGHKSVGGFVAVASSRDIGFRYSAYSDVLMDWPFPGEPNRLFELTDRVDLKASGENERVSTSQIAMGYYQNNVVAFYLLRGRLLFLFYGSPSGLPEKCIVLQDVNPSEIKAALDRKLSFDSRAMLMVMSSGQYAASGPREPGHGASFPLMCEANTFPPPAQKVASGRAYRGSPVGKHRART